jgi:hypothetical protein
MAHHQVEEVNSKDFTKNWVNSSRFVFYLSVFALVAFLFGASVRLYQHRYKGKPDIEIQGSTKYTPEYK